MAIEIEQFMCRTDNFGVLAHDTETGVTAIIDAPELQPILDAIARRGWTPGMILTTHHHPDHVEANLALKERFGLTIIGPAAEAGKIPGIDREVREGDTILLGSEPVDIIETPGHTAGHVSYHLPRAGIAFTADTLFALGCGRLFEGTPATMHHSMQKLAKLSAATVVYCGHEYTESNARFAVTIEPDNAALQARAAEIAVLRAAGKPTLPTTIGRELETNPYLRCGSPEIRRVLGLEGASDAEVFAEIRKRKDNF